MSDKSDSEYLKLIERWTALLRDETVNPEALPSEVCLDYWDEGGEG